MPRSLTLFTGQWADLPIEKLAPMARQMGYEGLELACWGDHFDVDAAASSGAYRQRLWEILTENQLTCFAVSNHLVGQAVCDLIDERHKSILPPDVWGDGETEGVRQRAADKMILTAKAARAFFNDKPGFQKNPHSVVVTGFTGSSVWHSIYAFPPTSQEYWDKGFEDFANRWTPILDAFAKEDVDFALEVHPTEIAFDTASAERALAAVGNHPRFGFNYDPSHLGYQGVDYVQFIRRFAERIFHVHVKDAWWGHGDGSVGNEAGIAGDPCWCTIHTEGSYPGHADRNRLNCGDRDGQTWLIPECDVSIRPGWFYHAMEDHSVRSAKNLVDLYFASVGRGTTFLLNLPPDRRGLIPEVDRQSLRGFRSHLDKTFSHNYAAGHSRSLGWQTIDGQRQWVIEINLPESLQVNVIELREDISHGHRVDQWVLETCDAANQWQELAKVQSVGAHRLVRFASQPATKFRVRITEASDEPLITDVGLYFEPELTEHRAQTTNEIAARITHKTGDEIVLDLQETMPLLAVRYTPDQVHRVSKYEIAFADVAGQWRDPIAGEFGNVQFNAAPQLVSCNTKARYVRFRAKQFCMGDALAGNEVNVLRV